MQNEDLEQITINIQSDISARAQKVLEHDGFTLSEYLQLVLTSVANNGLPEDFLEPNSEVTASILEMVDHMAKNKPLSGGHTSEEFERALNE
ncbi:type II toxin-antitoxin system RelB/DinJ family antitoxin [Levilactobacillus fujinensis]|uniref:Type II toxin-antitoxin system RelB/DinJ family antitoxin n=1 Tax=Levilactobacillus fujinensis TaxID=2486024 RepID=A0ABW1TFU8_9LACO|nr:type II toxin-antitoxin system RelB/DinJ family antitoxin [Levilactobacillus fujinensis]